MNLTYEERLEKTIAQLLPYYYRYHKLVNLPVPEIDFLVKDEVLKKVPKLFQPKQCSQPK